MTNENDLKYELRFHMEPTGPEEWALRHVGHDVRQLQPTCDGPVCLEVRQCVTCNEVYMAPIFETCGGDEK